VDTCSVGVDCTGSAGVGTDRIITDHICDPASWESSLYVPLTSHNIYTYLYVTLIKNKIHLFCYNNPHSVNNTVV
jgi:hypothetical protein